MSFFEPSKGANFYGAVKEAKALMNPEGCNYIDMKFNEISIRVSWDSNPDDLATIYDLKRAIERERSRR